MTVSSEADVLRMKTVQSARSMLRLSKTKPGLPLDTDRESARAKNHGQRTGLDILHMLEGAFLIGEKVDKQLRSPAVNVQEIFQLLDGVLSMYKRFGLGRCDGVLESAVQEIEMARGPLQRMDSEPGVSNNHLAERQIGRGFVVHRMLRHCLSLTGGCS